MDNAIAALEAERMMDVRSMDLADVRAIMLADHPELAETIAQRQERRADRWDEVWEGEYVMAPDAAPQHGLIQARLYGLLLTLSEPLGLVPSLTFNLGEGPKSYRVPDLGVHAEEPVPIFVPTALIAVEVLSPTERKTAKFDFFAGRGVGEVWLAEPRNQSVEVYVLRDGSYAAAETSPLFGRTCAELADFRWPAAG